ncbi:Inner membrane ABC transporter permease protein YdcV [Roseovarius albus]|uniref:Inner membrane ABC transporter permease protein YdcV n=2 Tax=Roseovarius albus TaxID=1247867 RepID=A0A1X6Z5W7_9RHOB|nr:Inner membrane ABC transporter permease protein YdcV [Roseovarius albus]
MMSERIIRYSIWIYLGIFFAYLLGPLVIMSITAFNSPTFPRATPWECLTFEWFSALFQDQRILNGIKNSIIVGLGTVILSVSMGLAGALMLTQIWPKLRATYYTIIIAPILIPGVVLGISTLVFWDRINRMLGLGADSFLSNGLFLTIIGQSTFIASYCLLVLVARLQRYDLALTEAALDLGASHAQAFRKILLPFMRPAIASAAVLAFLASFENYNTTTFTFGEYPTLTIELAQKVRYGITPAISALAFIIVALTVFFALINESKIKRKEQVMEARKNATVAELSKGVKVPGFLSGNPAAIVLVLFCIGSVAVVGTATAYSPDQCIARVKEQKQIEAEERIKELRRKRDADNLKKFKGVFDPDEISPEEEEAPKQDNNSGFGGVFDPNALSGDDDAQDGSDASGGDESGNNSGFGGVFDPNNLNSD